MKLVKIITLAFVTLSFGACETQPAKSVTGSLVEGENCNFDEDCQSGLVCKAGTCRKICTNNSDCNMVTQHCESDVCLPGGSIECGNGKREFGEVCDDGNKIDQDGCSSTCTKEDGWDCSGVEGEKSICATICGDGKKLGLEECDDGGEVAGDGCNANCQIEANWTCSESNIGKSTCTCQSGYFGSSCQKCACVRGTCEDGLTGRGCICPSGTAWTGEHCQVCNGYGADCRPYDAVTDIEGHVYKTVVIGDLTWMAENMAATKNKAGESVTCLKKDGADWQANYGCLYTFEEAKNICPAGWHLPIMDELVTLLDTVGNNDVSRAANLKSQSWTGGLDTYGFGALPAGYYYEDDYHGLGGYAYFWSVISIAQNSEDRAYALSFESDATAVKDYWQTNAFSVHCVKD